MILSRILLNPAFRDVWRWLKDPAVMHGVLWQVFPGVDPTPDARSRISMLYRAEQDTRSGHLLVYVQSDREPQWNLFPRDALLDRPWIRPVAEKYASIEVGDRFAFRIRACPRREVGVRATKEAKQIRRTARGAEAVAWLARQGIRHGFSLVGGDDSVQSIDESSRGHLGGAAWTFLGTRFDGQLRVVDPASMRTALRGGIGPRKAYGYGLLSIARPR